jgi:hypothetical protein
MEAKSGEWRQRLADVGARALARNNVSELKLL